MLKKFKAQMPRSIVLGNTNPRFVKLFPSLMARRRVAPHRDDVYYVYAPDLNITLSINIGRRTSEDRTVMGFKGTITEHFARLDHPEINEFDDEFVVLDLSYLDGFGSTKHIASALMLVLSVNGLIPETHISFQLPS